MRQGSQRDDISRSRLKAALFAGLAVVFVWQAVEHYLGLRPQAFLGAPWSWLLPAALSLLAVLGALLNWRRPPRP